MFTRSGPAGDSSTDNNLKVNISKSSSATKVNQQSQRTMDFAKREPHKTLSPRPSATQSAHHTTKPAHSAQVSASSSTKSQQPAMSPSQPSAKTPKHTKKMKTKQKSNSGSKSNRNLVYVACGILAVLAVALIGWVVISKMNKGAVSEETTFASNDTQTTITIEPVDDTPSSSSHTRTVYEYDGDNNVIGMKTYFEYADNEAAKTAYELIKNQPEFKGAEVIDKYIVVTADPNSFKGLTADDIRQQAEAIEQFQKSRKKPESDSQPEAEPESQPEPSNPEEE